MRPAVFLDRDDTLIANRSVTAETPHPGDLFDPALVQALPGAPEACARLRRAGFALVVVSNQGGVARGCCTMGQVEATNARVREVFRERAGVEFDAVYACPYHPEGRIAPYNVEHPWRKPAPGMFLAAAAELGLDIGASWAVGDAPRDIEAAVKAGIPSAHALLIGAAPGARWSDLAAAAAFIVQHRAAPP